MQDCGVQTENVLTPQGWHLGTDTFSALLRVLYNYIANTKATLHPDPQIQRNNIRCQNRFEHFPVWGYRPQGEMWGGGGGYLLQSVTGRVA